MREFLAGARERLGEAEWGAAYAAGAALGLSEASELAVAGLVGDEERLGRARVTHRG